MLNLIFSATKELCKQHASVEVSFVRIPEKSKQFCPSFLVLIDGEKSDILLKTEGIHDSQLTPYECLQRIVIGLTEQIVTLKKQNEII